MNDFKPGLDGVIATDTNVSYLDVDNEEIVIRGYDLSWGSLFGNKW